MIQRKQTLFLLLAILFMASFLYAPAVKIDNGMGSYLKGWDFSKFVNFSIIDGYFVYFNIIFGCIGMGLCFIAIFLFKFRKIQLIFSWLSIPFLLFCPLFVLYHWYTKDYVHDTIYYYGNISGYMAVLMVIFAIYFIRKDENLIKSLDRLR